MIGAESDLANLPDGLPFGTIAVLAGERKRWQLDFDSTWQEMSSGGSGSSPSPSDATPQPLGTAAAGSSGDYSRADHVHAKPTAADVGAIPAPQSQSSGQYLSWNGSAWVAASLPLYNGGVS